MSTQCKHIVDRTKAQCRNRTRKENGYCHVHQHMHREEKTIVDTCPICLDEKEIRLFQCNHGVCSECASQLRNCVCVMCRRDNRSDFTKQELLEMAHLTRHDAEVRIEEERQEIARREATREVRREARRLARLTDEDIRHVVNAVIQGEV